MKIIIEYFGNHTHTELDLQDRGVVVFTGENGAGKSMLGEAITWCLWGITLRSYRSGWSPTTLGSMVSLELDGVLYKRISGSHGTRLSINGVESTRDNNLAIIERFGTFKMFAATRVFHRALLSKFSTATDGERKALMESMLGVFVFDECLFKVREERRQVMYELLECENVRSKSSSDVAYAYGVLESLVPPVCPEETEDIKGAVRFLSSHELVEAVKRPCKDALLTARLASDDLKLKYHVATKEYKRVKRLVDLGECSMCGSAIGAVHEKALSEAFIEMETLGVDCDEALAVTDAAQEHYSLGLGSYDRTRLLCDRAAVVISVYKRAMDDYADLMDSYTDGIVAAKERWLKYMAQKVLVCLCCLGLLACLVESLLL
jgi:hypothetical protein